MMILESVHFWKKKEEKKEKNKKNTVSLLA